MPLSKYLKIAIDDQELDLHSIEDVPVSISYKLEDPEDFQRKKSSESFGVTVPATVNNQRIANSFHNVDAEDLSPDQSFRNFRPVVIESGSIELLKGKALLLNAGHDRNPIDYTYDFYGNNGDWLIDLL